MKAIILIVLILGCSYVTLESIKTQQQSLAEVATIDQSVRDQTTYCYSHATSTDPVQRLAQVITCINK